jgi:hypothetical protein
MAQYDPNNPMLVVAVFNVADGTVSINGEAWTRFQLKGKKRGTRPGQEQPGKTADDFPPPAEGDDTTECLPCAIHPGHPCHNHFWTGTRWKCIGTTGCTGPFCP